MGGPVLREGGIIGKNAFSDISFYCPKDQESILGNMNFQTLIFMKRSNVHLQIYLYQTHLMKSGSLLRSSFDNAKRKDKRILKQ